MSATVGQAIDGVVAGLEESIRRSEAEVERLTAQANELLSQAEQRREEVARQRGVLDDLRGRLGQIVGRCLQDRLSADTADPKSAGRPRHPEDNTGSRQVTKRTSRQQPSATPGSRPSRIRQVIDLIGSDPEKRWTAAALREHIPQVTLRSFNKDLKRLCDRGQVVRVGMGEYRLAGVKPSEDSGTRPVEPAPHSAPSAESAVDSMSAVRPKVVGLLGQRVGTSWRLEDLAVHLGEPAAVVHAVLQVLLRSGDVVTAIDGSYLIPGEPAASEGWAPVN